MMKKRLILKYVKKYWPVSSGPKPVITAGTDAVYKRNQDRIDDYFMSSLSGLNGIW